MVTESVMQECFKIGERVLKREQQKVKKSWKEHWKKCTSFGKEFWAKKMITVLKVTQSLKKCLNKKKLKLKKYSEDYKLSYIYNIMLECQNKWDCIQ